jgi:hypothetical protein
MTPFARFLTYTAILVFLAAIFDDWPRPHPNSRLGYKAGLWIDYLAIMAFWMNVFELAYRTYRWTRKHKTPIVPADDQPDPQDHADKLD